MEPNYANYSYNELLEALETIDHHAYPDRVNSIKARLATLDDNNGNVSPSRPFFILALQEKMENSRKRPLRFEWRWRILLDDRARCQISMGGYYVHRVLPNQIS